MKKINVFLISITLFVAGLNVYLANGDAKSDFNLSMDNVEQVAQGEGLNPRQGETHQKEDPDFVHCPTCGWDWLVCITGGSWHCTPLGCLHIDPNAN